ncbi:Asp-tRNA(Asn)/Glu-tRNA(Gln) amidotransferase subunit GatB [Bernardetia sp.]|uniref:Asp-tRNA(Asn)/Glu-tRNA(Gln) amidotransferase subunit GatB n=1 Tax=Bernardetia sp. TaxID=1937974 RepID=UPI0025C51DDE|nr:Asp-tRNA(Asn)/Glu-tRNA(Gln) amidotransferase subunit GatB [Bernardetia sp.]
MSLQEVQEKLDKYFEKYEVVIGLEVHAQLLTQTKAYSSDPNEYGSLPNTNVSVITLAHPGTLPKCNKKVLEYAIKMGVACDSQITEYNIFDRKNYFYPDLPKGYQITQDKTPICRGGFVTITLPSGEEKKLELTRIHMEEDAGKSMHLAAEVDTLVDLNRAGVPLIEIVSEPCLRASEEAYYYLQEIRRLLRYLEICDGNMEEGSMRCDANISVRLKGEETYRTRVEVKNMNSFRNVQRAIDFETVRQIEIYENGGKIDGETRMFDANTGITYSLRTKETLNDYRYFPEPDLQPLVVTEEYLETVKKSLPALPRELKERFMKTYQLSEYDTNILIDDKETALYFDELCQKTDNYKAASNWITNIVKSYLNENKLSFTDFSSKMSTDKMVELIALVDANKVSFALAAQKLFPALIEDTSKSPEEKAKELDMIQSSDEDSILPIVKEVLNQFPDKVEEYNGGKTGLLGMFMGQVMKKSKGKADPKVASALVAQELEKMK